MSELKKQYLSDGEEYTEEMEVEDILDSFDPDQREEEDIIELAWQIVKENREKLENDYKKK
jgi:hypothetical protein